VDGVEAPGEFGPDFQYLHEADGPDTTYHCIEVKVTNWHGVNGALSWDVEVKGIDTDPGQGGGKGTGKDKGDTGLSGTGTIVTLLIIVLLVISLIYVGYSLAKKDRSVISDIPLRRRTGP